MMKYSEKKKFPFARAVFARDAVFAQTFVSAQGNLKIRGTVSDIDGKPIELAVVKVEGQGAGTLTDLNGKYSFTCQSGDSVVVVFSMLGYQTHKRTLMSPHDSVTLKVVLKPSDHIGTGNGERATGSVEHHAKHKGKGHKNLPSTTGNGVEDLISTMAGVSRHDEMSSQYNVRGGSFDENLVYLNGQEVYRPMLVSSGQQEGLSIINSDMVDKIEFSTGGFPVKYGDKMSSVLDIKYKKPQKFEGKISASLLGGGVYAGWGNKHFSIMNSVRYKTTRYMLGSLETNGEYRPNFL